MTTLRVLVADDHDVVREGVRMLIEREAGWEVCATACSGREALEKAKEFKPDVAILDMTMPELNGLQAARRIRRGSPDTEVLIFTARESEELIRDVFEAGAKSYILKSQATEHLVSAIRALAEHKPFFTSQVSDALFRRFEDESQSDNSRQLSTREHEVIRLLAEGKANKEIAAALGVSIRTVETHRAKIMSRPGFGSLAAIVRYAVRHGMIEP